MHTRVEEGTHGVRRRRGSSGHLKTFGESTMRGHQEICGSEVLRPLLPFACSRSSTCLSVCGFPVMCTFLGLRWSVSPLSLGIGSFPRTSAIVSGGYASPRSDGGLEQPLRAWWRHGARRWKYHGCRWGSDVGRFSRALELLQLLLAFAAVLK